MAKLSGEFSTITLRKTVEEVLEMFKAAEEAGEENVLEKVREQLDEKCEKLAQEQNRKAKIGKAWDFTLEKQMDVFAEDDDILLRGCREEDKEKYYETMRQNSKLANRLHSTEDAVNVDWKDVMGDNEFCCSIIRKSDQQYLGFIKLHDTRKNLWEIGMEFQKEYQRKGYGTKAVALFLPAVSEITGKTQFQAFIDPENEPCQVLMKRIGASLIDIYDYFFHGDEEVMARIEEEHINDITPRMIELAGFLDVEPKKLLTYVLDYRFFVEDGEIINKSNI